MTAQAFLANHISALSQRFDVDVVLNANPATVDRATLHGATLHRARIERTISPVGDLLGLVQLTSLLLRNRYAAVHSMSPKAGLLSAIAAFVARVPLRIHTYTGQVWVTRRGAWRWLLKALDRLIAKLDTHLFVDSISQRDFLQAEGVLGTDQGEVIGKGSVCGVDHERFRPDRTWHEQTRRELDIPNEALVFLFVGRFKRDKGVLDLARAFDAIGAEHPHVFLLLVGPDEEHIADEIRAACGASVSRLRIAGFTTHPERFIAASDVVCVPSYREGFGAVVIEAAAAGVPAIGSRIYGVVDAIDDGCTGLLFSPGDVADIATAMRKLVEDEATRSALGVAARTRALRDFSKEALTSALVSFYEKQLAGAPRASG